MTDSIIDLKHPKHFFANKTLSAGHHGGDRTSPDCAMSAVEALAFLATGEATNRVPAGCPVWWAALTPLNDGLTDAYRQVVLRPRLWRYAVPASPLRDEIIVWRLVTLAVTRFAADLCEEIGLKYPTQRLRSFAEIWPHNAVDAASACAAAGDACAAATSADVPHVVACASTACTAAAEASGCVQEDRPFELRHAAWFAACSAAAAPVERRIEYVTLLLDAIDAELEKEVAR
jgi:hypothetical protein